MKETILKERNTPIKASSLLLNYMARRICVHRTFARESAPEVVKNNNLVKKNSVFSFDHDAEMLPED